MKWSDTAICKILKNKLKKDPHLPLSDSKLFKIKTTRIMNSSRSVSSINIKNLMNDIQTVDQGIKKNKEIQNLILGYKDRKKNAGFPGSIDSIKRCQRQSKSRLPSFLQVMRKTNLPSTNSLDATVGSTNGTNSKTRTIIKSKSCVNAFQSNDKIKSRNTNLIAVSKCKLFFRKSNITEKKTEIEPNSISLRIHSNDNIKKPEIKIKSFSSLGRIKGPVVNYNDSNTFNILKSNSRTDKSPVNFNETRNNFSLNRTTTSAFRAPQNNIKDNLLSKFKFMSKILGEISLFGIFEGNGVYKEEIINQSKKLFIQYFIDSKELSDCFSDNNFYTVLYKAFTYVQENLIKNNSPVTLGISGTTCLWLFHIKHSNKVYCANTGNSRCVLYSYIKTIPISHECSVSMKSEEERIIQHNGYIKYNQGKTITMINTADNAFPGLSTTRSLGNLCYNSLGVISEPEIIESNLQKNEIKCAVLGSTNLWKLCTVEDIGAVVKKYYQIADAFGACKNWENQVKVKAMMKNQVINEWSITVVFFEFKK